MTKTSITKLAAAACPLALALMSSDVRAQPKPGGTVRFAVAEESRGLDPLTAHRRFSEAAIHVHDSLGLFDVSNKPFPALATEWSANADSTEYTIKLRDDVVFHDGSKFNAEAVKAHFSRVFDKQYCCNNGHQYMNPYTGTEIVDDKTIKVLARLGRDGRRIGAKREAEDRGGAQRPGQCRDEQDRARPSDPARARGEVTCQKRVASHRPSRSIG